MTIETAMVAPLESGDHLTREEFHRRYLAHPEIKKAELIGGVVYVASPVSDWHSEPHAICAGLLYAYAARTVGVQARIEGTVLLEDGGEVQPDVFLFRDPAPAGGAVRTSEGYIEGPPQLVVEIAASSATRDLHEKLRLYETAGVLEYLVWSAYERAIAYYCLRDGRYVRLEPDERGWIGSEAFPGLRFNLPAMLAGDGKAVLAALDQG